MAELLGVAVADGLIELLEQRQSCFGDADLDDAAVVGHSLAGDEAPLLQAIDQTSNVGSVRDKLAGQHERWQGRGMLSSQQAEGVVLLRGQLVAEKQIVFEHPQPIVRPPEVEVALLLRRIETARGTAR